MKKIFILLLLTGISCVAGSQVVIALLFGDKLNSGKLEFGLTVNPALTNITGIDSKARPGLNLGIYFNIGADKRFFLHAEGIAKGSFGAKKIRPYLTGNDTLDNLFANGSIQRNIKAFSLPLLGRYAISKKFFAEAGLQADLMLKVKDVFQTEVNGNDLDYKTKVTDQFTLLDLGIAAGLFYKFRNDKRSMGMGVRYVRGLTDIHKTMSGTQVNTAWQLIITIPIGAAAKPDPGGNNNSVNTK